MSAMGHIWQFRRSATIIFAFIAFSNASAADTKCVNHALDPKHSSIAIDGSGSLYIYQIENIGAAAVSVAGSSKTLLPGENLVVVGDETTPILQVGLPAGGSTTVRVCISY